MEQSIHFKLNDKSVNITVDGDRMLQWVLRTDLGVTGPNMGADKACAVPARCS